MRKFLARILMLGLLISSIATATEFRSPWLSERGPIRYVFEKDNPDKYSFSAYALAHRREAHKAFMKHGTDTKPLTALFFNKANFPIQEIFPDNKIDPNSKYYNPYMALTTIHPRATYYEWGVNFGARLEYPVWKNKGRVGFRINIPVRAIEIEREDITPTVDNPEDEYILTTYTKVGNYKKDGGAGVAPGAPHYGPDIDIIAKAYKMDFISQLFQDSARTPALQFADNSAKVFGVEIAKDFHTNNGHFLSTVKPVAGVIKATATGLPNDPNFNQWNYVSTNVDTVPATNGRDVENVPAGSGGYGVRPGGAYTLGTVDPVAVELRHNWAFDAGDDVVQGKGNLNISDNEKLQAHRVLKTPAAPMSTINQDDQIMNSPNVYFFDTQVTANTQYSEFMNATGYPTKMPDDLKKGWLVLGYDNGNRVADAVTIARGIEDAVNRYKEDPYEWLLNRGFEFETQRRTGLGDIDLDFFYEHKFSDEWIGEFMLGLRLPTGSNDDFTGNAYNVHLGNGEHWEVKLGAMAAWQPIDWMNLKLDTYVSFVLEGTEQRCAVFKGSSIKNIGPKVDADVDWTYFVARLDSTLFHPKTKDISGTIGYEFFWKGEDNIHFKKTKVTPFYGDHYDGSTSLAKDLEHNLAEANTDKLGHKVRGEIRVQLNNWTELICGCSFTFAGKNLPREFDGHGGFNVKF